MSQVTLSGNDTIIINNNLFTGAADATWAELDFPNEIANCKTGKNGNSIYGFNETGKQCLFKLRILRGCADDRFLNNLISVQQSNFAGFALMIGQFVKKLGDGQSNITSDTYLLSGGIFVKQVPGKSNAEGDVEQSIAMYEIKFTNAPRALT